MPSDEDPEEHALQFGTDVAPRLLGQACALLTREHALGRFEALLEQNALAEAWDALADAAGGTAPAGFWALLAQAARAMGAQAQLRRALTGIVLQSLEPG